jgi:hypothetical protein
MSGGSLFKDGRGCSGRLTGNSEAMFVLPAKSRFSETTVAKFLKTPFFMRYISRQGSLILSDIQWPSSLGKSD